MGLNHVDERICSHKKKKKEKMVPDAYNGKQEISTQTNVSACTLEAVIEIIDEASQPHSR